MKKGGDDGKKKWVKKEMGFGLCMLKGWGQIEMVRGN